MSPLSLRSVPRPTALGLNPNDLVLYDVMIGVAADPMQYRAKEAVEKLTGEAVTAKH